MLETYMTEIIASVAILILAIIYFMIKKAKQKHNEDVAPKETKPTSDTDEVIQEIQETTTPEKEDDETVNLDNLNGEEEGSFGEEIDTLVVEDEITEDETEKNIIQRVKRTVPPHSKITKDAFKEFAGQRILVAEDNLINQKVISGLLADTGIEITIADDGQEALDILKEDCNFNFILMDAHMPRVDGFEATREIRKIPEYNHIVIVALSGDTAVDDIRKMDDAGMEEHLEKPLRIGSFYDILYAYSKNESPSDEDEDSVKVMITKEIDTDKGLTISGDDEEFYNEILDEFVNTYSTSPATLRELLNSGKLKEADKYLLDLSGITANIGAVNISQIVLDFKTAIANPSDKKYVEIFKEYSLSLQELLKDIKKYKA